MRYKVPPLQVQSIGYGRDGEPLFYQNSASPQHELESEIRITDVVNLMQSTLQLLCDESVCRKPRWMVARYEKVLADLLAALNEMAPDDRSRACREIEGLRPHTIPAQLLSLLLDRGLTPEQFVARLCTPRSMHRPANTTANSPARKMAYPFRA